MNDSLEDNIECKCGETVEGVMVIVDDNGEKWMCADCITDRIKDLKEQLEACEITNNGQYKAITRHFQERGLYEKKIKKIANKLQKICDELNG